MAHLAASPSVQGPDACVRGTHPLDAPNLGQVLGTPLPLGQTWGRAFNQAPLTLGTLLTCPRDTAGVRLTRQRPYFFLLII